MTVEYVSIYYPYAAKIALIIVHEVGDYATCEAAPSISGTGVRYLS